MSANNAIVIDRKTFKVYHWLCVDNPFTKDSLIGQGKDLEEAVDIAQKFQKETPAEYGIVFGG